MRSEMVKPNAQFCNEPLQNWKQQNQEVARTTYTRTAYNSRYQAGRRLGITL